LRIYRENQAKNPTIKNPIRAKENFIAYRNKLKKIIKAAEKLYLEKKFTENFNNIKKTWQIINGMLASTKHSFRPVTLTDLDGNVCSNLETAKNFHEYFSNVGPSLAKKIPPPPYSSEYYLPKSPSSSAFFEETDQKEIQKIIQELKLSSAVGHDEIKIKVLKEVGTIIASSLSHLINNSLKTGSYPDALKISKVLPIHKSGDTNLLSNYRPISILPAISKIFEKVLSNRLLSYFKKIGIPSKSQYGFQTKSSTYMAIVNVVEEITKSIENGCFSIGVFIDLSKAFDTMDHEILLAKLLKYGIRGKQYHLLKSYLSNRIQYVSIQGAKSPVNPVTCGVPQGSIIGPLF